MTPQVERLAKELENSVMQFMITVPPMGVATSAIVERSGLIKSANHLISNGWIHKDEALDYVEVCPACLKRRAPALNYACLTCQGRGTVKKEVS